MELDLKEALDKIEKASPYLQDEVRESFADLKVDWILKFRSMDKEPNGRISIFSKDENADFMVCLKTDVNRHPEFKSTESGTYIRVKGQIEKIDQLWVNLKNIESIDFIGNTLNNVVTKENTVEVTAPITAGGDVIIGSNNKNTNQLVVGSAGESHWYQNLLIQIIGGLVVTVLGLLLTSLIN
jgi:hypothetical protein